jgi:hypothetical protein
MNYELMFEADTSHANKMSLRKSALSEFACERREAVLIIIEEEDLCLDW